MLLLVSHHHMHVISYCKWDIVDVHLRQAKVHAAGASAKQGNSQLFDDHM